MLPSVWHEKAGMYNLKCVIFWLWTKSCEWPCYTFPHGILTHLLLLVIWWHLSALVGTSIYRNETFKHFLWQNNTYNSEIFCICSHITNHILVVLHTILEKLFTVHMKINFMEFVLHLDQYIMGREGGCFLRSYTQYNRQIVQIGENSPARTLQPQYK
jgi:hypothetical protein